MISRYRSRHMICFRAHRMISQKAQNEKTKVTNVVQSARLDSDDERVIQHKALSRALSPPVHSVTRPHLVAGRRTRMIRALAVANSGSLIMVAAHSFQEIHDRHNSEFHFRCQRLHNRTIGEFQHAFLYLVGLWDLSARRPIAGVGAGLDSETRASAPTVESRAWRRAALDNFAEGFYFRPCVK